MERKDKTSLTSVEYAAAARVTFDEAVDCEYVPETTTPWEGRRILALHYRGDKVIGCEEIIEPEGKMYSTSELESEANKKFGLL